jgi:hypothetical protein
MVLVAQPRTITCGRIFNTPGESARGRHATVSRRANRFRAFLAVALNLNSIGLGAFKGVFETPRSLSSFLNACSGAAGQHCHDLARSVATRREVC